jgi:hypothetical protein
VRLTYCLISLRSSRICETVIVGFEENSLCGCQMTFRNEQQQRNLQSSFTIEIIEMRPGNLPAFIVSNSPYIRTCACTRRRIRGTTATKTILTTCAAKIVGGTACVVSYAAFKWNTIYVQNPYCEQHTFKGQIALPGSAYWPHGAFASQLEMQYC